MKTVEHEISIIEELEIENFLKAILYSNDIIEIVWDTSIEEIEIIHLEKMQQVVAQLGGGKKMQLYFTMHEYLGISNDGRKYATSEEGIVYTKAVAVLIDDLAKKLIFNFFLNFSNPKVPTKGFRTKQECFEWLESINTP